MKDFEPINLQIEHNEKQINVMITDIQESPEDSSVILIDFDHNADEESLEVVKEYLRNLITDSLEKFVSEYES